MNLYDNKDWYYMLAFTKSAGFGSYSRVVFAENKKTARKKVDEWCKKNNAELSLLMKNNYIVKSQVLVNSGHYIK